MNRQKLISFIGRQVKGNWVSIILILTSSSINFKWLIRPKSPGASNLLVWSLSSSQGFWGLSCALFLQLVAHEKCRNSDLFKYILDVNTHFILHWVRTVMCVFQDLFTMFDYSCFEMFCSEFIADQGPVCHLWGRTDGRGAAFTSISRWPGRVTGLQGFTFTHRFVRPFSDNF